MSKYLDNNGLLYFWQKIKTLVSGSVPTKTSQLTNDSGYITKSDVPDATTIDSALSDTSVNPVQNKVVKTAIDGKVDKVDGKGLSTNDYTTTEKSKLAGIATGANNYTLPAATASALGGVKIGSNITNSSGTISITKDNVTGALGYTPPTKDTTYSEATTSADGLMSKADKAKLDAFGNASTYALKSDITGLYKYKGSKATTSALPTTGNAVGDVYNVEASGMNYVWTGTEWDALGEIFSIDAITNSEIDTITAS